MKFKSVTRILVDWKVDQFVVLSTENLSLAAVSQVSDDPNKGNRITLEMSGINHNGDRLALLFPSALRGSVLNEVDRSLLSAVKALDKGLPEDIDAALTGELGESLDGALSEFVSAVGARGANSIVVANAGKRTKSSADGAQGDFWDLRMVEAEESPSEVFEFLSAHGTGAITGNLDEKSYRLNDDD